MAASLEQKRIFLVALNDEQQRQAVAGILSSHLGPVLCYQAQDGSEALVKLENDPAHVVIVEQDLLKRSGLQIIEEILKHHRYSDTACLVASPPPVQEVFIDEIVAGRVQFLGHKVGEEALMKGVNRALNWIAAKSSTEFHLKFLSPGERLLRQGDKPDSVYIVKRGSLKATHHLEGREVLLGQVESGEFVGEMAYINGEPRSADVTALTDCELIEIPIGHLDQLLAQRPAWSRALMATLSRRLKKSNKTLTEQ